MFSFPSGKTKYGFDSIDEVLDINGGLMIKQTAIKEWLKLNDLKSAYFDKCIKEVNQEQVQFKKEPQKIKASDDKLEKFISEVTLN